MSTEEVAQAIETFLGSSMKLEAEVPKPSRAAEDFARGQRVGFERAQDYLRHLLSENESEATK